VLREKASPFHASLVIFSRRASRARKILVRTVPKYKPTSTIKKLNIFLVNMFARKAFGFSRLVRDFLETRFARSENPHSYGLIYTLTSTIKKLNIFLVNMFARKAFGFSRLVRDFLETRFARSENPHSYGLIYTLTSTIKKLNIFSSKYVCTNEDFPGERSES